VEVFIGYTKKSNIHLLEDTLEAWDVGDTEPIAIEMNERKFELTRRVSAENLATGDYVLCDIGYGPAIHDFGKVAAKLLEQHTTAGLIGQGTEGLPYNVVICRKGVITHWPTPASPDSTYINEHATAYQFAGYKVFLCHQRLYRQLENHSS